MRKSSRLTAFFVLFCAVVLLAGPAWAKRKHHAKAQTTTQASQAPVKSKSSSKSRAKSAKIGSLTDPQHLRVKSAVVFDVTSGTVLFEQNGDREIPPASLTKILTLYLVQEALEEGRLKRSDIVRVSERAACTGGSVMDLRAGERVSVEELMKGMAIASGNDACVAMAEHLGGSVDNFVRMMNRKARSLGMARTVFKTPNGLPAEGQVTTARDMLRLSRAYLKRFPQALVELHSTRNFFHNRRNHQNANRLLGDFEGADGLKTGFVNASGYNIIATARRDNKRIIAVLLGAPSSGVRKREAAKLLEEAFVQVGEPASALAQAKIRSAQPSPEAEEAEIAQAALHPEAQGGGLHGRETRARSKSANVQVASAEPSRSCPPQAAPAAQAQANPGPLNVPSKGRYTIQESSFKSRENAEQRKATLNNEGIPARLVTTRASGKDRWYRILIGRYTSLQAAETMRRRLAGEYGLPHVLIMQ